MVVFTGRDRIVTAFAERLAAEQSSRGEQEPFERTVDHDRLGGIGRTGRSEPAAARQARRNDFFVTQQEQQEQAGKREGQLDVREVRNSSAFRNMIFS